MESWKKPIKLNGNDPNQILAALKEASTEIGNVNAHLDAAITACQANVDAQKLTAPKGGTAKLPPLPDLTWMPTYSAKQTKELMREYGQACAKHALEMATQACEVIVSDSTNTTYRAGFGFGRSSCLDAIKNLLKSPKKKPK